MFHRLQPEIVARRCWKSIESDEDLAIDDGEVIEVAEKVNAVEQLMVSRTYLSVKSLTEALRRFLMKRRSVILIAPYRQ
jgi:hypothetical protein